MRSHMLLVGLLQVLTTSEDQGLSSEDLRLDPEAVEHHLPAASLLRTAVQRW